MSNSANKNRLIFRRRILTWSENETAFAALEDDYHEFLASVQHDGQIVIAVEGKAFRYPWTTCPAAAGLLAQLHGQPLVPLHARLTEKLNAAHHCTHLLDLSRLAMAQAGRKKARQYDISIPDVCDEKTSVSIHLDGQLVFTWHIEGDEIIAPEPFAGHHLSGAARWKENAFADDDEREAGMLLRRALMVALRRHTLPDRPRYAREYKALLAVCHSFQPEHAAHAESIGEYFDFTNRPEDLLKRLKASQMAKAVK